MDGVGIETVGRSRDNEKVEILGSKALSRRKSEAVAEGGGVIVARAESSEVGLGVGAAAEKSTSKETLRNECENLIVNV